MLNNFLKTITQIISSLSLIKKDSIFLWITIPKVIKVKIILNNFINRHKTQIQLMTINMKVILPVEQRQIFND